MLPVSEKKRLVSKHCFIPLQGEKGKVQYKGGRGVERKVQHNMAVLGFVCLVSSVKRQTKTCRLFSSLLMQFGPLTYTYGHCFMK